MKKYYWLTCSYSSPHSMQRRKTIRNQDSRIDCYTYEYVTNDPLKLRVYTLINGLKVYLSQYRLNPDHDQHSGKSRWKFDPADATGLAHYLEHIMLRAQPISDHWIGKRIGAAR